MKIAIFGSNYQKEEQIRFIVEALHQNDVEIFLEENFHKYLRNTFELFCTTDGIIKGNDFDTDLVMSIGGDGTFLRSAAKIVGKGIPILGVNTGRLGFLADTFYNEVKEALHDILQGNYHIEERTRLCVDIDQELYDGSYTALNEVAILKQDTASMVTVNVWVNGEFLTAYEADGLLVSTPTGSTAYAMSVGGPILSPSISNFILTPIASHALTSRPLLIEDDAVIEIQVSSRNANYLLSLDGGSTILPTDVKLKIMKSENSLKVIKRGDQTFYKTLRDKLMWGADPRGQRG